MTPYLTPYGRVVTLQRRLHRVEALLPRRHCGRLPQSNVLTEAEAEQLITSLTAAVRRHVTDRSVLDAIGREIEKLMPRQNLGGEPPMTPAEALAIIREAERSGLV